jgi:hypothetical protein
MHLIADRVESLAPARISRSKEARAVGEVLRDYARRGVFREFTESNMRIGRIIFRMLWHDQRRYRFVFDLEASELSFPALLPGVTARSPRFRELKLFLRPYSTPEPAQELPEQRRIDPTKGELRLSVRHGALTLGVAVKNGEYEYCTRRVVQLAEEVLTMFVGKP